jgi:hypothetical protein
MSQSLNDLFDFDQPNLSDIEITNLVNQQIGITIGHKITQNATIRVSQIPMTLEQFREALPKSPLPAFIRGGAVKLRAIKTQLSVKEPAKKTKPVEKAKKVEEPVKEVEPAEEVVAEIVVSPPDDNPFGAETNEGLLPDGPPKVTEVKVKKKAAKSGKKSAASKKKTTKKSDK